MSLSSSAAAKLRASITSNAAVSSQLAQADWPGIANFYNVTNAAILWRKDLSIQDFVGGFVWAEVSTFTSDQTQRLTILTQPPFVDATNANIRNGFASVFTASAAPSTQAALLALAQRPATRFEALFTTAAGLATVSSQYGVVLSNTDVQSAMGA